MKNFEKFKTPEEAFDAKRSFCKAQKTCLKCRYMGSNKKKILCDWAWLYDEAESNEIPQWQNNIMAK